MAPTRTGDMAKVAMRALFAGTIACFMTACVAGECYILFQCLLYRYVQRLSPLMHCVGFQTWVQLEFNLVALGQWLLTGSLICLN